VLLLQWPNSVTLTTPNVGEDMEQQEKPFVGGMQNGTAKVGRQFGSFLQS